MNAGFLDVLLNAGDHAGGVVAERIDVKFRRLFQKLVDQDWTLVRKIHSRAHVFIKTVLIINDRHRAAAEHVTWTHEHRISDSIRGLARSFDGSRRAILGLWDSEFAEQCAESFSIFGEVDRIW